MLSPTSLYGYNYIVPLQSYGAWPPQFVSSSVPLSNYSSLNGATNPTTPASQIQSQGQQQQQPSQQQQSHYQMSQPSASQNPGTQQSPPPQHMIIEYVSRLFYQAVCIHSASSPSLSTMPMNGTLQNQFPATTYPSQASAQQIPYSSFAHALGSFSTPYYRQTAAQGTLSPQVLHSNSAGMPPAMFYGQPPSAPPPASSASSTTSSAPSSTANLSVSSTVTPEQQAALLKQQQEQQARARKEQFDRLLKPLLQSSAFSGAGAVQTLVDRIDHFGSQDVEPSTRLEILTKMRDGAPNHYFRAWSENGGAMDITREWLKAAAKGDGELKDTIMPLLHVRNSSPLEA
jgi:protein phosphatase 1 regulatory subunit 10